MFRWEQGRQQSGYFKMKLLESSRLGFDCYLLKYGEGSEIPPHTDPVDGKRHYRANVTLRRAEQGGTFGGGERIVDFGRLVIFRPDLDPPHWVGRIIKGKRLMLSIGWVLNE